MINVTTHDIQLVKQKVQRRYAKVQVLNREWRGINTIIGTIISGNINIDSESEFKRTASLTMHCIKADMDIYSHLSASYYIRLSLGIEDNNSTTVSWYEQGVFLINSGGFDFDKTTKQLSLSLTDLMSDLSGERSGTLKAYSVVVRNSERIDNVIKNVLEICGVTVYDVSPIGVLRETDGFFDSKAKDEDYLIPYDLTFSVGVTAKEIINKCVNLYPYYEYGFDESGTFFVRRKAFEQDSSYVILDAYQLESLVISENTSVDWFSVKNIVEVWGKDGLYYGEAKDDNPDSPFYVEATKPMRLVVTGSEYGVDTNNITDRYKDSQLAQQLQEQIAEYQAIIANIEALENPTEEEQAELAEAKQNLIIAKSSQANNVDISGDYLAKQWAEKLLYEKSRLTDTIAIQTVGLPFVNDGGFKISYRSKIDDEVKTYVVKSVSHDLSANTTTLNAIRFYNDQCSAYQSQLEAPEIVSSTVDGMTVTVTCTSVPFAEKYALLIDYKQVALFTGITLTYTLPNEYEGNHLVAVRAIADGFQPNGDQNYITVTFSAYDVLATSDGDRIVTESGNKIKTGG